MSENEIIATHGQELAAVNAAEIDMQIATAKKYPRDEIAAIEKSIKLATANLRIAQSCQYFRPVGKKDGIQQFAPGPSIRLAEIMKCTWQNLRIAKRVIGTRDGMVGVEWGVHDLEANMMDRGEVWRPYFNKDSMIPVITAAAMKFAERDAVFAAVPKSYADEVLLECKRQIVGGEEGRDEMRSLVIGKFVEMGVSEATLFRAVPRKDYPEGSDDEVIFLIGLYNTIKDGICSVEDVFGSESSKPADIKPTTPKQQGKGGKGSKTQNKAGAQEQTAEQRFLELQQMATVKLGDEKVDGILKNAMKKCGKPLTEWTDTEHDAAANTLADAMEA